MKIKVVQVGYNVRKLKKSFAETDLDVEVNE